MGSRAVHNKRVRSPAQDLNLSTTQNNPKSQRLSLELVPLSSKPESLFTQVILRLLGACGTTILFGIRLVIAEFLFGIMELGREF